jgi:hypothetical protein
MAEPEQPIVSGVREPSGKPRVPKQSDSIGRSGYKGDVEVYEPSAPGVPLVNAEAEGKERKGPAEDKAKRRHRKKAPTEPLPEGEPAEEAPAE